MRSWATSDQEDDCMDAKEIRRLYYIVMVDVREKEREDAAGRLKASDDPRVQKLAGIAQDVSKVVHDEERPDTLTAALKAFDNYPSNEFWRRFMEVTGEVLIKKAQQKPEDREELLGHAFRAIARSQDGGFVLSKGTTELVESIRDEKTGTAKMILAQNSRNTVPLPRTFRGQPASKGKKGRRRRADTT